MSEIQADLRGIQERFEAGEITLRLALDLAWQAGYFDRVSEGDKSPAAVRDAISQLRGMRRELTDDESRLLSRLLCAEWALMPPFGGPDRVEEALVMVRAAREHADVVCGGEKK